MLYKCSQLLFYICKQRNDIRLLQPYTVDTDYYSCSTFTIENNSMLLFFKIYCIYFQCTKIFS